MRKKKSEIMEEQRRITETYNILAMYLGLERYVDDTIYCNEDDEEIEHLMINGYYCKYPSPDAIPGNDEIIFDTYNNTKLMNAVLMWYISKKGWQVEQFLYTNPKPDAVGHLEIKFTNGVVHKSQVYYKDSLKAIDLLLQYEQAAPGDYQRLRGIDICDRIE